MYDIETIKAKTNLVATAQSLGLNIRKAGDRCVSPLRPDAKNPTSFMVGDERWFDYGSGQWGDVIDLVAEIRYGGDKGKAIRDLALKAGVASEQADGWRDYTQQLNNRIASYQMRLTQEDFDYLRGRGLTDETISALRIGRNEEGRLVIPYIKNGYVAYYCTRALPGCMYPDSKYRKMPIDTHNANIVWGWDSIMRGGDTLVIAEGAFDAISFWQEGYPVLSAITGFFSHKQLADVLSAARQFKRVFFVYDNDKVSHAGEKFAEKMARILLKERIDFIVGRVPDEYKDVSEYYEAGEVLQSLVNNAINGLTYLCEKYDDVNELAQFLRPIALYQSTTAAENAIKQLKARSDKTIDWKELQKKVLSAPPEKEVCDKVIKDHDLLYMEETGFYEWNGRVWERVTDGVVRGHCNAVLGNFVTDSRSRAACNLIRTEVETKQEFNKLPVLTFPNGTLELETRLFRPSRKEDYCTVIMDYDYDPEAKCPTWERFINEVTNDDGKREINLQHIPGYALMPHCKYEKIFMLIGGGGNGKGVYFDIIKAVFGEKNISGVLPSGVQNEFQRILMKDSLLNLGTDVKADFASGEIREYLLQIASGETIQACYKGKTHVLFNPRCKLVFGCNSIPTAEVVNGLDRRLWFIEFPCKFVEYPDPSDSLQKKIDVNLKQKLRNELPGIFNWVYKGYWDLKKEGSFVETDEQVRILGQFRVSGNPIIEFCNDKTFAGEMTRDEIYTWYREWCETAGHRPLGRINFLPKFREVMGKRIKEEKSVRRNGNRVRVFIFVETE